jgi:hypothetical protein
MSSIARKNSALLLDYTATTTGLLATLAACVLLLQLLRLARWDASVACMLAMVINDVG